jgi:hypothetical protein
VKEVKMYALEKCRQAPRPHQHTQPSSSGPAVPGCARRR